LIHTERERERDDRTRVKKKGYQDQHTGSALPALPLTPTSGWAASGYSTVAKTDRRDAEYEFGRLESELRRPRGRSRRRGRRLDFVFRLDRDLVAEAHRPAQQSPRPNTEGYYTLDQMYKVVRGPPCPHCSSTSVRDASS
jgi:hypothetical protein